MRKVGFSALVREVKIALKDSRFIPIIAVIKSL